MPLDRRVVSINFVAGLDQKTDPKLTTKLTTADNVVLRKNGTIEKRLGFVADGSYSLTNANPVRVFPFGTTEFVFTDELSTAGLDVNLPQTQNQLSPIGAGWGNRGKATLITASPKIVFSSIGSVTASDIAIIGRSATQEGLAVGGFLDATDVPVVLGGMDVTSGNKYFDYSIGVTKFVAGNMPSSVKAVALTSSSTIGYFLGLNRSGASLTVTVLGISATTLAGNGAAYSSTSIGFGLPPSMTSEYMDVVALNGKIFFAAKSATTTIAIGSIDPATSATSLTIINTTTTVDLVTIATPAPGTDRIRLVWLTNNSSNTAKMSSYSLTLSQILAPTTFTVGLPGYGPGLVKYLGACENVGLTTWSLFTTQSSTTGLPIYTLYNGDWSNTSTSVVSDATYGDPTRYGQSSCILASKPFLAHGCPHVVLNNTATAQASYYVARRNGVSLQPVGRFLYGLASAPPTEIPYPWLPTVAQADNDNFYVALRSVGYFNAESTSLVVNNQASLVRFNFSTSQPLGFAKAADSTFFGGGFVAQYDGVDMIESGFLSIPVIAITPSVTTSGGGLSIGSYSVVAVKEATDQSGKLYRSSPSLPVSFAISTTTGAASITVTDSCNYRGALNSSRQQQISIAIYRTTANGTIYYRDQVRPAVLGFGSDATGAILSKTDSTLAASSVLYTQGGALPNWSPDSTDIVWLHDDRLFCSDPGNNQIVRFSKEIIPGQGPQFSQANFVSIQGNERITAGVSLDSNCVVFREREILVFSGSGPDDTGLNGAYSSGQLLYADLGATGPSSICRFSNGIVFKSKDKGFYLLTRDLQVSYIGADVESYNGKTVVSAQVVGLNEVSGSAEECRFLCSDGTLLTYNYYNQQWTTATLAGCVDAVQTGGRYVVVNTSSTVSGARVFQQSLTTYTDAFSNTSTTYQMTVETGWVKTADVQGFQRIWAGALIGEAMGAGNISVEIGYDYETAYNEMHTATMSSLTAANYTGGATAIPQCNFVPTRQKCEAIRFRIKDYPTSTGAVMKLTNISLECGVKTGTFRLPAAKGI